MRSVKVLFLTIVFWAACLSANPPPHQSLTQYAIEKDVDYLLLLVQKRLVFMHEVARTKWKMQLPIEDLEREFLMLNEVVAEGEKLGLNPEIVRAFFSAQIQAAKLIQADDFLWFDEEEDLWDENLREQSVLDLKLEIRPYLDQMNRDILVALTKVGSLLENKTLAPYVSSCPILMKYNDIIDFELWDIAVTPLLIEAEESEFGSVGYGSTTTR